MRPARRVLDSYGLIAFLRDEPGADDIRNLFRSARDSQRPLLLCAVNWGEVFYITLRTNGPDRAEQVARLISTLPIEVIPADLEMAQQAAEFKAKKKMSYADCFAAALAKSRKAALVTGDKEFKQVEGEVKILWI
ncbi:MAG: type II toxin-antitoxin system VapC family toxin [Acidobacteria bacterium]|nr:type II toxin-antitoxin system VapC family toxin [Acidobacteriota bacterium]